jgi:hypothetical protein
MSLAVQLIYATGTSVSVSVNVNPVSVLTQTNIYIK